MEKEKPEWVIIRESDFVPYVNKNFLEDVIMDKIKKLSSDQYLFQNLFIREISVELHPCAKKTVKNAINRLIVQWKIKKSKIYNRVILQKP